MGKNMNDGNVKSLNAKKLDVNFDSDDFFNSFEPVTSKSEIGSKPITKNTSKL
jgi:hypothetical protein